MFATYMWHLSSCGSIPFTVDTFADAGQELAKKKTSKKEDCY